MTTSVHEYLTNIQQLLESEQYEAVVGHCYHILKQYPRHIETYKVLARGLFGLNRHDEAKEMFQRVLSADPHDLIAHIGLADLAQLEGNSDGSQHHLERAFEINPYNGAIQDELSRHYDTGDEFGVGRLHINEGGLVHLYLRGEMYEQALTTLEHLLSHHNDRVDLEVLLAEALWWHGNRVEAAEVSLKVLDSLPNCIVANAVLSNIWFGSERVSDAKKRVRNLQAMVLMDEQSTDPESVVGAALLAEEAPQIPELFIIEPLEEIVLADVAVSLQDEKPSQDLVGQDLESDPGDMYDWLSGVVKPSAEQRMEEVLEPDSWPAGEAELESDWFVDEAVEESTAVDESTAVEDETFSSETILLEPDIQDIQDEDSADEFVIKFNEQAKPNADIPEWIATDNMQTAELEAGEEEEVLEPDEDVPEWLTESQNEDFEPITLDPLTASKWLTDAADDQFDDAYGQLPESVKDTQDWLAGLTQELSDITEEESDVEEWLVEEDPSQEEEINQWLADLNPTDNLPELPADDQGADDNNEPAASDETESEENNDWLNELVDETSLNLMADEDWIFEDELGIQQETDDKIDAENDWFGDERLSGSVDTQSSDLGSLEPYPVDEEQNLAPLMNNEEKNKDDNEKKPKPEEIEAQAGQVSADDDDWLSKLTQADDADDDNEWLADLTDETAVTAESDETAAADLSDDQIDQYLLDALDLHQSENGAAQEATSEALEDLDNLDQWLEDLSDEGEDSPGDWLSNLVEEEKAEDVTFTDWLNAEVDSNDVLEEPGTGLLDDVNTGLTDILGETNLDQSDMTAEDDPFAGLDLENDESGLTNLLDEPGIDSGDEDDDSLAWLGEIEPESDLTDQSSADDLYDLEEEGTLTDLLSETGLAEPDLEADEGTLTDLLTETGLEELEPEAGTGLTDFLSDSGLDEEEADLLDEADEGTLTDLLSETGLAEPDLETDEGTLTDLLTETGLEELEPEAGTGLTDFLSDSGLDEEEADLLDEADEGTLTDLLSETGLAEPEQVADEGSLTDLLSETGLEELEPEAGTGLTDFLSDSGLDEEEAELFDEADEGSLTDLFSETGLDELEPEAETGLTDLLPESELMAEESDQEDLFGTGGLLDDMGSLTDVLTETGLEESESEAEPGLTDLLSETGLEDDAFEEGTGFTDLLSDSELETAESDPIEAGLTDLLGEDTESEDDSMDDVGSLTDLLTETGLEELEPEAKTGLTDLLEENDLLESEEALDSLDDLQLYEETAVSDSEIGLTDLLTDTGLADMESEDPLAALELPDGDVDLFGDDEGGLTDLLTESSLSDDEEGEDILEEIETDLPLWINDSDGDDYEETPEDELPEQPEAEEPDIPDSEDESEQPLTTGLLRKIDEIPEIKASIEEKLEQERLELEQERLENAPFEPEMPDYLTSPSDTAWLDQLSIVDQGEEKGGDSIKWDQEEEESSSGLDWLDSNLPEPEAAVETPVEAVIDESEVEIEADRLGESDGTSGDMDDAMSWLEDLAAEQTSPIEPLPTIAEVLDEETEPPASEMVEVETEAEASESDSMDDARESEKELLSDLAIEEELTAEMDEALAEINDAMAWLDELGDDASLLEEEEILSEDADTVSDQEIEDEELEVVDSPISEQSIIEISEDEIPEDPDEALAWLEQLAAEEEDSTIEEPLSFEDDLEPAADESTIEVIEEPDSELHRALDWLEDVARRESSSTITGGVAKTTTDTLKDALDWLDHQTQAAETAVEPVEPEKIEAKLITEADGFDQADPQTLMDEIEEIKIGATDQSEALDYHDSDVSETAAEDEEIEGIEDLFDESIFDIPDDPDEAMAWLNEAVDDFPESDADPVAEVEAPDLSGLLEDTSEDERAGTAEPEEDQVHDSPEGEPTAVEPSQDEIGEDLDSDILANVPEDPDEAMEWLEQLAARQGTPLEELPSVSEPVDQLVPPPADRAEESLDTIFSDDAVDPFPPLPDEALPARPEPIEFDDEDELPEGLPDWFSLDASAEMGDEIPSQTDWLDSVPDFDGSEWLSSESEAASKGSEPLDILPETGPLIEAASTGTGPLPDLDFVEDAVEDDYEDEEGITDEPDSAVYKLDTNQLEMARDALERQEYEAAISEFQTMVAEGNGLMMLIGELETVSETHPEKPAFRRLLGDAYMRNGQLQKALTTYREALDLL